MSQKPRRITTAEQPLVAAIWHKAWHETQGPFVPQALVELRTLPDFLRRLVAMGDLARTIGPVGAPLGFCAIRNDELYQIFVGPSGRGTGVGAALLTDAEDRLRAAGTTMAHLDCLKENTAAIRFYTKMGWTAQGLQTAALDTHAGPFMFDCMVFSKALT